MAPISFSFSPSRLNTGEFDALNKEIEKRFPSYTFSKLPKKHILGNLKKDIINSRRVRCSPSSTHSINQSKLGQSDSDTPLTQSYR